MVRLYLLTTAVAGLALVGWLGLVLLFLKAAADRLRPALADRYYTDVFSGPGERP